MGNDDLEFRLSERLFDELLRHAELDAHGGITYDTLLHGVWVHITRQLVQEGWDVALLVSDCQHHGDDQAAHRDREG